MSTSAVLFEELFQSDLTFSPVSLFKLCFLISINPQKNVGPFNCLLLHFLFKQVADNPTFKHFHKTGNNIL